MKKNTQLDIPASSSSFKNARTAMQNKEHAPVVAIQTLGCKLNHAESDSIATRLKQMGFEVINRDSLDKKQPFTHAKYIVINTCTVTAKADRKSRHSIYQAIKGNGYFRNTEHTEEPTVHGDTPYDSSSHTETTSPPIVIVTGCFVGSAKKDIEDMDIDYIVDNSKKSYIPEIIDAHEKEQIFDYNSQEANYFSATPADQSFHTRNNLKIQDGCDNFCTFCIIPLVRGTAQSLPLKKVVENARTMIENGSKEIVLTGVNMSRYSDLCEGKEHSFSDLLEALLKMGNNHNCRFHISSLEPDRLDDKFFDLLQNPKLCSHLHLCLQSGSEKILLKMRRMYTVSDYMNCIERIKQYDNNFNFTTDIIVGFPEESDHDFMQSMKIVKETGFSHIHIFPYSVRQGTRAERMKAVDTRIQKDRIQQMQVLCDEQKHQYRISMLHKKQEVLIEKTMNDANEGYGFTNYYIPVHVYNTDTHTTFTAAPIQHNSFIEITPTQWKKERELVLLANISNHSTETTDASGH